MRYDHPARSRARTIASPLLLFLGFFLSGVGAADAKVFTKFLDADKYGHLDQAKTTCAAFDCGPVSAVNSFVYLQNASPAVYGSKLVPPTKAGEPPTEADLIAVANKVGKDFMKSCVPCGANDGTYIEDFIVGKQGYLESVAPGKTRYQAQINITWRFGTDREPDDAANKGAKKPTYVVDGTKPTLDFLYRNIAQGADVELFLDTHYITLTGIEYDDATNKGKIAFIDPDGGASSEAAITGIEEGFIVLDYLDNGRVYAAVVEAPVPEPGTWLLFTAGGALLVACGRRRR